jgi:hypothetical protein
LTAAGNLAASLLLQGKYDEEEKMEREMLAKEASTTSRAAASVMRPKYLALALCPPPLLNPLQREQNIATIARQKAAAVGQKESKVEEGQQQGGVVEEGQQQGGGGGGGAGGGDGAAGAL